MTGILGRAVGQAEATIGSAIGNKAMQERGESAIQQADVDAQKPTAGSATAGPFTGNTSGGAAKENTDRTKGAWNEKVGGAKESVGNFVGSDSLASSGATQSTKGSAQKTGGQIQDAAQGVGEHARGNIGSAAAYVTGDTTKKAEMDKLAADGKARLQGLGNDSTN